MNVSEIEVGTQFKLTRDGDNGTIQNCCRKCGWFGEVYDIHKNPNAHKECFDERAKHRREGCK